MEVAGRLLPQGPEREPSPASALILDWRPAEQQRLVSDFGSTWFQPWELAQDCCAEIVIRNETVLDRLAVSVVGRSLQQGTAT